MQEARGRGTRQWKIGHDRTLGDPVSFPGSHVHPCLGMRLHVPYCPANTPPFCNLSLRTKRRGGAYTRDSTLSLAITPSLDQEMFSNSVDAGFILVLPFHHGGLEPDYVGVSTRGGRAYAWDEDTSARLSTKNAGGAYAQGGGGIFAGHYGMYDINTCRVW